MKLSEETKKLFNAPWQAYPLDDVGDAEGYQLCSAVDEITAKRIEHLPELYEALREAVDDACGTCAMMQVDSNSYDFVKNGCPFFEDHDDCLPIKWIEVLRKVRDRK